MLNQPSTPIPPVNSTFIDRQRERRDLHVQLIPTLRKLASLAEREAWYEGNASERARLARLVQGCDDVLRRLVNAR